MADGLVMPRVRCHDGLAMGIMSKNLRKEGLPKRELPWSIGGHNFMISSMAARKETICPTIDGLAEIETEEIFLLAADSEREKTKASIREYVGDARKRP